MRSAGQVVRFDKVRGYGFISPNGGGEDVFLHANDLGDIEKSAMRAGVRVTFDIEAGDRGMFATSVLLAPKSAASPDSSQEPDGTAEDDYYDVLSARELRHHLTEMFLQVKPSMNAEQVLEARERVIEFAQKQGLLDEL
jgi:cold shock protein